MGKRKSKKAPAPNKKKTPKLDTVFECPFCNHSSSVKAKLCGPTIPNPALQDLEASWACL